MTSKVIFENSNINEQKILKATGCEKKIKIMAMNWSTSSGNPVLNVYTVSQKDALRRKIPFLHPVDYDTDHCIMCLACGEDLIFEVTGMDPNQQANDPVCLWVEVFYETKCEPETCC